MAFQTRSNLAMIYQNSNVKMYLKIGYYTQVHLFEHIPVYSKFRVKHRKNEFKILFIKLLYITLNVFI